MSNNVTLWSSLARVWNLEDEGGVNVVVGQEKLPCETAPDPPAPAPAPATHVLAPAPATNPVLATDPAPAACVSTRKSLLL